MLIKLFITPQKQTVNPADKTVLGALQMMGHQDITAVSIGRYIEIELDDATPREGVEKDVIEMCTSVKVNLVNPIMEDWRAEVVPASGETFHIKGRRKESKIF